MDNHKTELQQVLEEANLKAIEETEALAQELLLIQRSVVPSALDQFNQASPVKDLHVLDQGRVGLRSQEISLNFAIAAVQNKYAEIVNLVVLITIAVSLFGGVFGIGLLIKEVVYGSVWAGDESVEYTE